MSTIGTILLSLLACHSGLIFLLEHPEPSTILVDALRGATDTNKEERVPLRYASLLLSKCMLLVLDDFVGVTKDEKQMMHLWNSFVRKHRVLAEGQIPWACEAFSGLHGQNVVKAPVLIWKLMGRKQRMNEMLCLML